MDGRHDFDFLFGRWSVSNRRLRRPLSGSHEWYEFEAAASETPLLDGEANLEQWDAPDAPKPIHALALRLYNRETGRWSIYWSNAGSGEFSIPTVGSFKDGVGLFYDREEFENRPILVRFRWSRQSDSACRWEQAFSIDDGKTWEDNWIMDFTRLEH